MALTRRRNARTLADNAMSQVVKGMVQVQGTTYRIARIKRGHYSVIRVLDDIAVGTFTAGAAVEITHRDIDPAIMREIARIAIQGAKTSWVGRLS